MDENLKLNICTGRGKLEERSCCWEHLPEPESGKLETEEHKCVRVCVCVLMGGVSKETGMGRILLNWQEDLLLLLLLFFSFKAKNRVRELRITKWRIQIVESPLLIHLKSPSYDGIFLMIFPWYMCLQKIYIICSPKIKDSVSEAMESVKKHNIVISIGVKPSYQWKFFLWEKVIYDHFYSYQ